MRPSISIHSVARAYMVCVGLLSPFVSALAVPATLNSPTPTGHDLTTLRPRANASTISNEFLIRLMPLGASITNGYLSTDHNGYRDWIRQQLRYKGWDVEMVGSLRNGTMVDNYNEGHFGYRVDQLPKEAEKTIPKQPNLILINAGTDDALQRHKISSTADNMDSLLDLLYEKIPNTTIILSTLLPNKEQPEWVEDISDKYRVIAARRRLAGDKLVLADMSSFITTSDLADATHPNDKGYKKMASIWWAAMEEALKENMIQKFTYTLSEFAERKLDNSTSNPNLPSYTAPAQPTNTGGAWSLFPQPLWLIMGIQLFTVFWAFS